MHGIRVRHPRTSASKRKSFSLDLLSSRFKYLMGYLSAKRIKSQWGSSHTCLCRVWAILTIAPTHVERIRSLWMRLPSHVVYSILISPSAWAAWMRSNTYAYNGFHSKISIAMRGKMILYEHKSQSKIPIDTRTHCGHVAMSLLNERKSRREEFVFLWPVFSRFSSINRWST